MELTALVKVEAVKIWGEGDHVDAGCYIESQSEVDVTPHTLRRVRIPTDRTLTENLPLYKVLPPRNRIIPSH